MKYKSKSGINASRGRTDAESGLRQRKALGQVFLRNTEPMLRCVDELKNLSVERVIEIGPGAGALTKFLVEGGFPVAAIEKDERFAEFLQKNFSDQGVHVECADFLDVDIVSIISQYPNAKWAIVGNIPYLISSAVVQKVLAHLEQLVCVVLMTQREFALRCMAKEGSKTYGSLSVFCGLRARMSFLMDVPRTWFTPVPQVDSILWTLAARDMATRFDAEQLRRAESIARQAFAQRRKKLSNSLKSHLGKVDEGGVQILLDKGIDFEKRPEQISPESFVLLADTLLKAKS